MTSKVNDTKQKLINTASDLIWLSSFSSVSVDHICKKANVNKGSFYHFFSSKIDLAVEAMDQYFNVNKPYFDDIFSPSTPPLERFERLAEKAYEKQVESYENYGRYCGCPFATLGAELAGSDDKIQEKVDEIVLKIRRYYETALRDLIAEGYIDGDINVSAKAEEIYAYVMGQMLMARILNTADLIQRDLKTGLMRIIGVKENIVKEKISA